MKRNSPEMVKEIEAARFALTQIGGIVRSIQLELVPGMVQVEWLRDNPEAVSQAFRWLHASLDASAQFLTTADILEVSTKPRNQ